MFIVKEWVKTNNFAPITFATEAFQRGLDNWKHWYRISLSGTLVKQIIGGFLSNAIL